MHKTVFAVLAASLFSGCVATATTGTRRPPPPPPPRDEPVRVVEPPHREHDHDHRPPPPPPPDRGPRVIEGIILDAQTRQPIDRASVDITSPAFKGERTVQTGPDGRYRTEEIPPGDFTVRVRREGYQPFLRQAQMGDGTARVDFELHRR